MRETAAQFFKQVQQDICSALERLDGAAAFGLDNWQRADGGGGITRVLSAGKIFEQAGVNFSQVSGTLPADMSAKLTGVEAAQPFFATGISLVIHPLSPYIPTTHANYRYLEVGNLSWFGGGGDLTPYYLFEEDAEHFHRTLKTACDMQDSAYYPLFKKACDEYFYLPHRGEARGIGGIFFDYLGRDGLTKPAKNFELVTELAPAFLTSYVPIVEQRKDATWTEDEKAFQLMRRGRYVEFNLLFDRGTLFGLKTGGRIESIFMSLPPLVKWQYDYKPIPGSREEALLNVLRTPREWV